MLVCRSEWFDFRMLKIGIMDEQGTLPSIILAGGKDSYNWMEEIRIIFSEEDDNTTL